MSVELRGAAAAGNSSVFFDDDGAIHNFLRFFKVRAPSCFALMLFVSSFSFSSMPYRARIARCDASSHGRSRVGERRRNANGVFLRGLRSAAAESPSIPKEWPRQLAAATLSLSAFLPVRASLGF